MSAEATTRTVVRTRHGLRLGYWVGRIVIYAAVLFGAFLYSMPFIWMLSTSVKPAYQVFAIPPIWIPEVFQWDNYTTPWATQPFARFYTNTIVITVSDILGLVFTSSLVAFAFARMRFRGRDFLFMVLLSTMMLPGQVTLIPLYVLWSKLGLVNTLFPLIIPYLFGGAFQVFLIRQYMMTLPLEYDDAARIDGASWFQIYSRIILPLSSPALGVVAIFAFTWHWNEFLGPLIYLNDSNNFTVPLGLALLNSRYTVEIQRTMAQAIISIIPVLVVFFAAQRFYIQGIVISGVKG